jgi:hypothetical protein
LKFLKFICLPQFDIGGIFYIIHVLLRKFDNNYCGTFFRNYFGDFLALIIVIPLLINIQLILNVRKMMFVTIKEILFYAFLFSLVFEVISPLLLKRGTSCFYDCIAYFLGGFLLYFSQYITEEKIIHNK